MRNRNRPARRARLRPEWENTCNYCLYYHANPLRRSKTSGNCSYHNQWIESSEFTTCSEMSPQALEPGIYVLESTATGDWAYNRRSEGIRTKLFAMEGGRGGVGTVGRSKKGRG
jgi:hypothetical protein